MNEDFLQYVWKFQRFISHPLTCANGQSIDVIKTGIHNFNAGPDFLNSRVRIDDTVWVGNVEIHINGSDWYRHHHDKDPAYDNVILHVVYTNDKPVLDPGGQPIPVLVLKDLIDYQIYRYYKSWVKKSAFIACEELVGEVPDIIKTDAVQAEAVSRVEIKSERCLELLRHTRGDVEETFYSLLCRAIGLSVNAIPFEQLAQCTPVNLIRKNSGSIEELEALLLGQAGFLDHDTENDPYVSNLKNVYSLQKRKHKLTSMPKLAWKLSRLRPQNFPVVRIAQLARIYFQNIALAQKMIEKNLDLEREECLSVSLNTDFWKRHYTLDKASEPVVKSLGKSTVQVLLINAVVPFLFGLASYNKDADYKERAIQLLEKLAPEKNAVSTKFTKLGFHSDSALDSQGLIGLKKNRCDLLKCLNCKIGIHILKQNERRNLSNF